MAQCFVELFGEELCSAKDSVKTSEVLHGKIVGIYFSAHWCPPCRGFTPELAKWYTTSLAAKGLEVVFVSSDKSQRDFDEYFATMPWKALPYAAREKKEALSKKFKVQGIPTFVVLDADGNVITRDGRSAVSNDPTGEDFPWKPKPFHELLGTSFIGQGNVPLDKSAIEGKVLGLYFSAHWCPPCRGFTPQLAEWYKAVSSKLPNFEIVFVSSDKDEDAFQEYFAEMPWIALPHKERKRKEQLSNHFDVEGIPTFVIVDKDGSTITTNGRSIPTSDPEGKEFPWFPKPLKTLAEPDGINDTPSLVVLMETADVGTQEAITAAMDVVAAEYQAKAKESGEDEVIFFTGKADAEPIIKQIRELTKQPADEHQPVTGLLLDLNDEGSFYLCSGVNFSDVASIKEFLHKYQAKELPKQKLQR